MHLCPTWEVQASTDKVRQGKASTGKARCTKQLLLSATKHIDVQVQMVGKSPEAFQILDMICRPMLLKSFLSTQYHIRNPVYICKVGRNLKENLKMRSLPSPFSRILLLCAGLQAALQKQQEAREEAERAIKQGGLSSTCGEVC